MLVTPARQAAHQLLAPMERLAADADPAKVLAAARPGRGTGRPSPGTQLVREHAGRVHRVTVTAAGYLWNGTTYASLSPIAEAITGTRWNGPRFFGLRERGGPEGGATAPRRARTEARP